MNIGRIISRAIKDKKWIKIEYKREKQENAKYWICIDNITKDKKIECMMYNHAFSTKINNIDVTKAIKSHPIDYTKIVSAKIVEGSHYTPKTNIHNKILKDLKNYEYLEYDKQDLDILDYLSECTKLDNSPYLNNGNTVKGIDASSFVNNECKLSLSQFEEIINTLKTNLFNTNKQFFNKEIELVLNIMSLKTKKGYYVVAYKTLLLDIENKTLKIDDIVKFNQTWLFNTKSGTRIENFTNYNKKTFEEEFNTNYKQMTKEISKNLNSDESIDTNPIIFEFVRQYNYSFDKQYEYIKKAYKDNKMNHPIQAFFNRLNYQAINKKNNPILLFNEQANIDQLRVIYNSINNPITFVQGPPGTGKTSTILNVITSIFFNNETALIASQNNKPLNDIYDKLINIKYNDKSIPLPILRLGSNNYIMSALKRINDMFNKYKNISIYEDALISKHKKKTNEDKILKEYIKEYDDKLSFMEKNDAFSKVVETIDDMSVNVKVDVDQIMNIEEQKREKEKIAKKIKDLIKPLDKDSKMYFYYQSCMHIKRLKEPKYKTLLDIVAKSLNVVNEDEKSNVIKEFKQYIGSSKNFKELLRVFPIIISTNISSSSLSTPDAYFDLTIIDEAGQCPINSSLSPILRGKRLLLVGDINQLEPITNLDISTNNYLKEKYYVHENYDYLNNSILKCIENINSNSLSILLSYHYRSKSSIINFSNQRYYNQSLNIQTTKGDKDSLLLINTKKNKNLENNKNVCFEEINQVVKLVKSSKYKPSEIGIITPFKLQSEEINKELKKQNIIGIEANTIHKFQGAEKKQIIMSLAITKSSNKKTFDWVKNNRQLINVGTTRAKEQFTLVCDTSSIKKLSDTKTNDVLELCKYIKTKGKHKVITPNKDYIIPPVIGTKPFNSKHEGNFLKTIKHVFTVIDTSKKYKIENKVKLSDILEIKVEKYREYYLKAHFDFVITDHNGNILLAVELDGIEHFNSEITKRRDFVKNTIAEAHNLNIVRITNSYSRRYHFIKDSFIKILKIKSEK